MNFGQSIAELNCFVFDRAVRAYQDRILRGESLTIVSPYDGAERRSSGSVLLPDGEIGYRFGADGDLWLAHGAIKDGFPLVAAYHAQTGEIVPAGDPSFHRPDSALLRSIFGKMQSLWAELGAVPQTDTGPILVIGHRNFAHNLWNELSGLGRWLDSNSASAVGKLRVSCHYEPFGPIEQIFPAIAQCRIVRPPESMAPQAMAALLAHIGSTLVTGKCRQAVIDASRRLAAPAPEILRTIEASSPVFWITARVENRTCDNQCEFLSGLLLRLGREFPGSYALVDGFSFPEDLKSPALIGFRAMAERRAAETAVDIERIIANAKLGGNSGVASVSGLGLSSSLMLAGLADYYIAHAGTLQHKIAWIHNTPGYVHSCTAGISAAAQRWYVDQVENGTPAAVPSKRWIIDRELGPNLENQLRNLNYSIADIPAVLDDIVADIRSTLKID